MSDVDKPGTEERTMLLPTDAMEWAQRFHETYERLARTVGYTTRAESAVPWDQVPEKNRRLMILTCDEVVRPLADRIASLEAERDVLIAGDNADQAIISEWSELRAERESLRSLLTEAVGALREIERSSITRGPIIAHEMLLRFDSVPRRAGR